MKNGILVLISSLLGVMTLAIVMTIAGRMNRSVELQSNLSAAVEGAIRESQCESEDIEREEMLAVCMMNLIYAIDSDMSLTVQVYQADSDKGILSLGASGSYLHPNGMSGEVSWDRAVIYETQGGADKVKGCEVCFYLDKEDMKQGRNCYKRYVLSEGEALAIPVQPYRAGERFAGWSDVNDYIADFSIPVTENLCYYATWE